MKVFDAKRIAILIVVFILLADQFLKFWIKLNMYLGEEFYICGNWFIIHFTENKGMAFGWQFSGQHGKIILSIIRIIAVSAIGYYLVTLIRQQANRGLIAAISLVFAGALGNIIDSAFYGMIFSESGNLIDPYPAVLFPPDGGYASFLHGRVVDMFYFPIIQTHYPEWFPWNAGKEFIFFRPVFNIADASISTGVCILLIFQQRFFGLSQETDSSYFDSDDEAGDDL